VKTVTIRKIEWDEGEKERLVWKFPEKNIAWNSTLIVLKNQVAALFTGHELFSRKLKMHDVFSKEGEYVLSPSIIPLLAKESPEAISKPQFSCFLIYCSTREHSYSPQIHTGDSFGQGWVHGEANALCKFRIADGQKFLNDVVANHKRTSNDKALIHLDKGLADELFRCHPPYGWPPKQKIPLVDIWKNVGIELIELKFENYKQSGGGVG
jgi:membrane protease subunit (stomatin/prohibitin family)